MKYYFIAGEPSGDLHAGNCMKEILRLDPSAVFAFTGGELMEKVSGKAPSIHIREMAFMGFVDVLKNILTIRKNFSQVKKDILGFRPDLLVLVDYPGFNLRMAKWAHRQGIKTDFYISPTVWAWKAGRVEIIRKYVNRLFLILPFEEAFYKTKNYKAYFVGHPLIDAIEEKRKHFPERQAFLHKNGLADKPLIAVLPGSRAQEISRMLHIMLRVIPSFPGHQFVFAGSRNVDPQLYHPLKDHPVKLVYDQTYELMHFAEAGIIKSGTSTLESALLDLPQVVCYKGGAVSFMIARQLVDIKYISLPNLIMDREVIRELVQDDLSAENIIAELGRLISDPAYRERILSGYKEMRSKLGGPGASARLANFLVEDAAA